MTGQTSEQIIADIKQEREKRRRESMGHEQSGERPLPPRELPPPSAPMKVAREFVARCCLYQGVPDALTLRHWHGGWWVWRVSHWEEVEPRAVNALLYAFTEHAVCKTQSGDVPWSPTRRKIGDLLEALSAIVILSDKIEQPCWIDGRRSGTIVAVANGLLDVTSRHLHDHSPLYFNQAAVPFAYDALAPEPVEWVNFVKRLWPSEPDCISALGE